MSNIIDGIKISNSIINNIKNELTNLNNLHNLNNIPTVAIIQINDKKESSIYIKKKYETCLKVNFNCIIHKLDVTISINSIYDLIETLNNDKTINGIMVEMPIPDHLNEEKILNKISYLKDIDGINAYNFGNLALEKRSPVFIPCTAMACLEILKRENIILKGKNVVIIGKSNIVGLPLNLLLLKEMATVTTCHIETIDINSYIKMADIIISACGKPKIIKKEFLKDNVIIIDVGINIINDVNNKTKTGYKIVGDVDFDNVKNIAYKITPVPGGIGPVTVSMMLLNVLKAFKLQNNLN